MLTAYCRITQTGRQHTPLTIETALKHADLVVRSEAYLRCGALTTLGDNDMAAKKAAKKPAKKAAKKKAAKKKK